MYLSSIAVSGDDCGNLWDHRKYFKQLTSEMSEYATTIKFHVSPETPERISAYLCDSSKFKCRKEEVWIPVKNIHCDVEFWSKELPLRYFGEFADLQKNADVTNLGFTLDGGYIFVFTRPDYTTRVYF